ncbi:MAG: preprotein translocase subunit YajC [Verrucomicrobiota bacterium]
MISLASISASSIVIAQQQGTGGVGEMLISFFPFIILFVVLYLIIIRPERRRAKEHRELVQRLKAGDRVITNGGLHGTITKVGQSSITVQVAEGTDIEIERGAVARLENEPATETASAGSNDEKSKEKNSEKNSEK